MIIDADSPIKLLTIIVSTGLNASLFNEETIKPNTKPKIVDQIITTIYFIFLILMLFT